MQASHKHHEDLVSHSADADSDNQRRRWIDWIISWSYLLTNSGKPGCYSDVIVMGFWWSGHSTWFKFQSPLHALEAVTGSNLGQIDKGSWLIVWTRSLVPPWEGCSKDDDIFSLDHHLSVRLSPCWFIGAWWLPCGIMAPQCLYDKIMWFSVSQSLILKNLVIPKLPLSIIGSKEPIITYYKPSNKR